MEAGGGGGGAAAYSGAAPAYSGAAPAYSGAADLTVSDMLQRVPKSNLPNGFGPLLFTKDLIEPAFKECWTLLHDSRLIKRQKNEKDKNKLGVDLLKGFHGFLIGKVKHFEKKPESSPWVIAAEKAVAAAAAAEVKAAKVEAAKAAEAAGAAAGMKISDHNEKAKYRREQAKAARKETDAPRDCLFSLPTAELVGFPKKTRETSSYLGGLALATIQSVITHIILLCKDDLKEDEIIDLITNIHTQITDKQLREIIRTIKQLNEKSPDRSFNFPEFKLMDEKGNQNLAEWLKNDLVAMANAAIQLPNAQLFQPKPGYNLTIVDGVSTISPSDKNGLGRITEKELTTILSSDHGIKLREWFPPSPENWPTDLGLTVHGITECTKKLTFTSSVRLVLCVVEDDTVYEQTVTLCLDKSKIAELYPDDCWFTHLDWYKAFSVDNGYLHTVFPKFFDKKIIKLVKTPLREMFVSDDGQCTIHNLSCSPFIGALRKLPEEDKFGVMRFSTKLSKNNVLRNGDAPAGYVDLQCHPNTQSNPFTVVPIGVKGGDVISQECRISTTNWVCRLPDYLFENVSDVSPSILSEIGIALGHADGGDSSSSAKAQRGSTAPDTQGLETVITEFEHTLPVLQGRSNTKQLLAVTSIIVACNQVLIAIRQAHNAVEVNKANGIPRNFVVEKVRDYMVIGEEKKNHAIAAYNRALVAASPPEQGRHLDDAFTAATVAIAATDAAIAYFHRLIPDDEDEVALDAAASEGDTAVYDYNFLVNATTVHAAAADPAAASAAAAAAANMYFIGRINRNMDKITGDAVDGILSENKKEGHPSSAAAGAATSADPTLSRALQAAAAALKSVQAAQNAKREADANVAYVAAAEASAAVAVAAVSVDSNKKQAILHDAEHQTLVQRQAELNLVQANEVAAAAEADVSKAAARSVYRKVMDGLSSIWGVSSWFSGGGGRNKQLRNVIVNKIKRKSRKIKKLMVGKKSRRISKHRGKYGKMKKTMRGMVRRKTIKKLK
jgi:hypothetical protein